MIINSKDLQKTRKLMLQAQKEKEKPIIIQAQDDKYNRQILEKTNPDILLSPELGLRKNKLKKNDSGLNHHLAKLAKKNNIAIGLDLKTLRNKTSKQKAIQLTKVVQNLKILRKAKTALIALNQKDSKNSKALLQSLGASSQQTTSSFYQ